MQQGGAPYRALRELPNFEGIESMEQRQQKVGDAAAAAAMTAEAASPISSRPPAAALGQGSFEDLGQVSGGFLDEDELERGASGGNRWPRQETVALLKIRSDMDAAFRDATLKAPLWDDVSRKLGELGYNRSAKKCKEKFENVHKYYKRTKEGRAGRQDGKNYRFFSQLEALHSAAPNAAPPTATTATTAAAIPPQTPALVLPPLGGPGNPMIVSPLGTIQPAPVPGPTPSVVAPVNVQAPPANPDSTAEAEPGMLARINFSSNTSSATASSESDEYMEEEEEEEERGGVSGRKRKRARSDRGGGRMMEFFEGLMKQMMERQEVIQQRFLEAIEKREQDRMIREEAWKQQEMARLSREHEMLAQERTMSASRDAAIIAFLQKLTGQTIQLPHLVAIPAAAAPPPQPQSVQPEAPQPPQPTPEPQPQHQQQDQNQLKQQPQSAEALRQVLSSTEIVIVAQPEQQQQPPRHHETSSGLETISSSSRWPKSEVLALIQIRSSMESRYQEAGPKGPLWEEVSAEMQRLGFNRSSKRCKEKWENINKYFKKVKESNKKRPEDAKTCPYFHQLDTLYKQKILSGSSGSSRPDQDSNPQQRGDILAIMPPPPLQQQQPQPAQEAETKIGNAEGRSSMQVPTSNGEGFPTSYFQEGPVKKPEDIVKELMGQQKMEMNDYSEEDEGDEFDDDDNDDTSGDEDDDNNNDGRKMAYKIEFQRQNPNSSNGGNQPSSFLAIVQ